MPNHIKQIDTVLDGTDQAQGYHGPLSPSGVKALKTAIAVLGAMIALCVIVIMGRVIYLASGTTSMEAGQLYSRTSPSVEFVLPTGAQVQNVSLNGERAIVTFRLHGQTKISIFNLHSGEQLTQIRFISPIPSAS